MAVKEEEVLKKAVSSTQSHDESEKIPLEKVEAQCSNEPFFRTSLLTFVSPRLDFGQSEAIFASPFNLANSTKGCEGFPSYIGTFGRYIELANANLCHPEISPRLPSAIFRLDNQD